VSTKKIINKRRGKITDVEKSERLRIKCLIVWGIIGILMLISFVVFNSFLEGKSMREFPANVAGAFLMLWMLTGIGLSGGGGGM